MSTHSFFTEANYWIWGASVADTTHADDRSRPDLVLLNTQRRDFG